MKKCIVLLSGGLDSRLAVKIMQKKGFSVVALFFKLPFSKDNEKEVRDFLKDELGTRRVYTKEAREPANAGPEKSSTKIFTKGKLKFFDCTKGKLLQEYLEVIKNAKFGRGAGFNPCVDCKIFMFNKAKEFADKNKIEFIATGEVEGQRPMSQMKKSLKLIEEKSGLGKRLLRPLSELDISGRRRDKQMALAKKFNISYPTPAGGCALCEKELKKRFETLIKNNLINEKNLKLVNIGRHFFNEGCWFVVARDEKECKIIESFNTLKGTSGNFVKGEKGKPAVYFNKKSEGKFAEELKNDFGKNGKRKMKEEKL